MRRRLVFLFVDGLGLGPADPARNPVHAGVCPVLADLLAHHPTPVDACLGMPGLPQSATGQTTIFTGVNAAQLAGRHVEGFPTVALKEVIRSDNIFRRLAASGLRSTFANGYFTNDMAQVHAMRTQSVTTVATLSAFGEVRTRRMLEQNQAVSHDLTRETLLPRGYTGPLITPEAAAGHLVSLACDHDFTLFEFFLTDRAGHTGDLAAAAPVLRRLDAFLGALLPAMAQAGLTFMLTSDHGNIEDMSVLTHTLNPVPCVAVGPGAEIVADRVTSLTDITPAVLTLLGASPSVT